MEKVRNLINFWFFDIDTFWVKFYFFVKLFVFLCDVWYNFPVKNIEIYRYGANGEGIGENNGKVIFVQYALKGENVDIDIQKDGKNFFVGKISKINKKSENRVSPSCPYFEKCGGCDIMHASLCEQKAIKQQIVENNLKKYANYTSKIENIISGEKQLYYRNHITFQVSENGRLGFFEKESHKFLEIKQCLLANQKINECITMINSYLFDNNLCGYNEKTKSGDVKQVDIKFVNNSLLLTFVCTNTELKNINNLCYRLNCLNVKYGIYISQNIKNSTIYGRLLHQTGIKQIECVDQNIKSEISPFSFLQINDEIKDKIYSRILELVTGKTVFDAYCGRGVLSCLLSKKAKKVVGVEIVESAVFDAQNIAKHNNITNVEFICDDVKNAICTVGTFDTIILDPPRKGCERQVLESIIKILPNEIVYLSCASNTLARDLTQLMPSYDIIFIEPYDMFPQTRHIETLVYLKKK